ALFPHMSVESNVGFGLRQDGISKAQIKERVDEMLDLVQLGRFASRKPHQLSGGQRQRVALARALVKHPKLLLLDEPLAALDKKLREQTQFELVNIQERVGITFIVVTHDQSEAMTLSTRMAVMNEGRIVQVGTPSEVYEYPGSRFVADFIGSVNLIEGRVLRIEGENAVIEAEALDGELRAEGGAGIATGDPVAIAVRPEKLAIGKAAPSAGENTVCGVIDEIAYQGDISIYQVRLPSGTIMRVTAPNRERSTRRALTWEDEVYLSWQPDASILLTS
ncbi:MAG: TOBE domain-containing protein, partial [Rhodospirillaceae bacterium]|nr:TOBE domain-containing protein [Rhodospirillaceae bacterium]